MNLRHVLTCLLWRAALAVGLLALFALLGMRALPASAASPSFIRIVDASPDIATVDVFVDGAKFQGNVQYATITDYRQLPAGSHKVLAALISKGVSGKAVVQTLSVQAGVAYTVAAIGTKSTGFSLTTATTSPAPPPLAHLLVPAIGINAPIESVEVRTDGTMETPRQSPWNDVGLYNDGPRPGDQGSAVISGHLDRPGGNPAVFWHLRDLHVGDTVLVVDAHGKALRFHVTRIGFYPPKEAPIQDIFGNTSGRFLNLMTCAGDWIPTERQTALRLVVYTALG